MLISHDALERLEWNRVLEAIARRLRTPMGRQRCEELLPLDDPESITRSQARCEEMRHLHREIGRLPLSEVKDPEEVLKALGVARRTLAGSQVYETVHLLKVAGELVSLLRQLDADRYVELGAEWARFPELVGVIDAIDGHLSPSGEVEDNASAELARLRREVRQLSERLTGVLDSLVKAEWTNPVLRDSFITVRNNRFVLPVRTDTPRRFHGIVHGRSSTEKTLFVEPIETVEINNQLVRLRDDEEAEVERILLSYTELLRGCREEIRTTAAVLGEMDLLEAIATWAEQTEACRPELVDEGGLHFVQARHPVLEASLTVAPGAESIVPLDVEMPKELRALVISGPNAGGKTVALKTIGLLTLMAHAGLPLPAASAQIPRFRMLLVDVGDDQSIEDGLSTFSSHIRTLADMLKSVQPPALVLVDEIGTGTDPAEGAALGTAIVDELLKAGAHVVATTHHQALKTWAYRTDGVLNAACAFDDTTLRPTYRLVPGVAGASIGLTMAEQLGLPAEVVENARKRLDPAGVDVTRALESVRALAGDLEEQRVELVSRRRELEEEHRDLMSKSRDKETRRQEQWSRRMDEVMRTFRSEATRMISRMEDVRDRRALEKERSRRERELKESFSEELRAGTRVDPAPEGWSPKEGDRVLVSTLSREGTIRRLDTGKAEVMLGRSVFTVALSDLRPAGPAAAAEAPSGTLRRPVVPEGVSASVRDKVVSGELHLIGFRVEEGLGALEKYLDDASLAGLREARIIHGLGTGRLRKAVRAFLDEHPDVISWREAEQREGGAGATVITLEDD